MSENEWTIRASDVQNHSFIGLTDPWSKVEVPQPPGDAPREQVMEFAALVGVNNACAMGGLGHIPDIVKRVVHLYCERWHPALASSLPPREPESQP